MLSHGLSSIGKGRRLFAGAFARESSLLVYEPMAVLPRQGTRNRGITAFPPLKRMWYNPWIMAVAEPGTAFRRMKIRNPPALFN
jgi:hypothetical protein